VWNIFTMALKQPLPDVNVKVVKSSLSVIPTGINICIVVMKSSMIIVISPINSCFV
jgi:hypothetical protein